MAKYYKGNIINVTSFPESIFNLNFIETGSVFHGKKYYVLDDSSKKAYLRFKKSSNDYLKKLIDDLKVISTIDAKDEDKKIYDNLFIDTFKMNADNIDGESIIYEKIYDENGNCYGKELITGNIFPINSNYSEYDIKYEEESTKKVFYDIKNGRGYYLEKNYYGSGKCYLIDANGGKHEITNHEHSELYVSCYTDETYSIYIDNRYVELSPQYSDRFTIKITPKMEFPSNQRIEYAIASEEIANELEVNNYFNKFITGFGKRKRKKDFMRRISEMCLTNYLGDNINFVSNGVKKSRVNEEVITKEMQELEYSLAKLKSISIDDYNRINGEYQEVLNHDNNGELYLNPLAINTIISLQNKVELAFICHGGNSKIILEFLNKQAHIYLENYKNNNNEKTELSINELDKLCENFLNSKSSYSYKEQNEILRNLALLYFFEIYENKDILKSIDLENSYVVDNIKRIITVISTLNEEGIIKEVPNTLYDITNIDELLDFIKKIEFNINKQDNNSNEKKLIK